MSPNLFVATQKLFSPHKWFKENKTQPRSTRKTEHWAEPRPGLYEYIPGRGWYLIAKLKKATHDVPETNDEGGPVQAAQEPAKEYEKLDRPVPVHWSRVLKRYLLEDEYKARKRHGAIQNEKGRTIEVGFFRLDDGVAWVQCWDQEGTFIPGPYKLWCISQRTGQFRPMLKGDDPNFTGSRNNSRSNSRNPSFDRDGESQASRSTEFFPPSNAPSNRDGPSVPNTRPSSIRMTPSHSTSASHSQPASRRTSPRRNGSIEYEKDKAAMRQMARDHREALMKAASQRQDSKMAVEQIERGRSEAGKEVASN